MQFNGDIIRSEKWDVGKYRHWSIDVSSTGYYYNYCHIVNNYCYIKQYSLDRFSGDLLIRCGRNFVRRYPRPGMVTALMTRSGYAQGVGPEMDAGAGTRGYPRVPAGRAGCGPKVQARGPRVPAGRGYHFHTWTTYLLRVPAQILWPVVTI